MQILFYILIILSSLLGIAIGSSAFILGLVAQADEDWGWMVAACSLLYMAHPVPIYWLFKNVHQLLAIILTTLFIVASVVLFVFL